MLIHSIYTVSICCPIFLHTNKAVLIRTDDSFRSAHQKFGLTAAMLVTTVIKNESKFHDELFLLEGKRFSNEFNFMYKQYILTKQLICLF